MTTDGLTPNELIEAIRASSVSGIIKALGNGNDIELPDMHGFSGLPLRTACFVGNPSIVRELLRHGANPNAVACDGPGAPLRLALRKGHQDIVEQLLEAGAVFPDGFEIPYEAVSTPVTKASPSTRTPDNKVIEWTSPDAPLPGDDADAPGPFGTETRLLSMDLLFLEENEIPLAPTPATKNR